MHYVIIGDFTIVIAILIVDCNVDELISSWHVVSLSAKSQSIYIVLFSNKKAMTTFIQLPYKFIYLTVVGSSLAILRTTNLRQHKVAPKK